MLQTVERPKTVTSPVICSSLLWSNIAQLCSAEVSAFRTRRWHLSSQIFKWAASCDGVENNKYQLPALWCYGRIGCGPNWRSTKRWSHCWGSSRWWRNATRRWNSCVAEQAGYITSSTRSEGISVPTWLRSGLKFRVQTIPHPANLPLQKLSDSDRSSIYTSTWEGAGAARRPVSMASGWQGMHFFFHLSSSNDLHNC